jgi:ABC-type multidrug transport system fused ATPase/permease subunit
MNGGSAGIRIWPLNAVTISVSENEALIQQARWRTAAVIAHRPFTIAAAGQLLVVDGGRIVERGRHADLFGASGVDAELFETQFRAAAG